MQLHVRYMGEHVERGRMGAVELGAAILGFGEVVGEVARVAYGEDAVIRTEVSADFANASFGIEFFVTAHDVGLFSETASVTDILTLIFGSAVGGAVGLTQLFRWMRGKSPTRIQSPENGNVTVIHGDQQNTILVRQVVMTAYRSNRVADGVKGIVAPLSDDGAEAVEFSQDGTVRERIERSEKRLFTRPSLPDEIVLEQEHETVLEVVSLSFREGNKWRFAEGDVSYWAAIADAEFLARVAAGKVLFGKGYLLRVRLHTTLTRSGSQLDASRVIKLVLEHIPPPIAGGQSRLPLPDGDANGSGG